MQIDEGEVQYRLEDDAIDLRCDWTMLWENLIVTPFLLLYVLYHSVEIHLLFTLLVILVSVIKLSVPIAVKKLETKYDKETREYNAKVRAYETEFTTKPHIIKLFGLSTPMVEKMNSIFQIFYRKVFVKKTRCTTIADQISSFLNTFCILVILLIGALLVSRGMITAGAVAAMIGYFSVYNTIMENAGWVIRRIPVIGNSVQRLRLLYEDYEEVSGMSIGQVTEISASNLSFSYGDTVVWDNLKFKIRTGEKVAICGANGSGKSTILKLLSGLTKKYNGSLKLNGTEFREVSIGEWRKQFAYITQEPYLFQAKVWENVALGNLKASREEVLEVMRRTGVEQLANREVSVEKNDLSGGEKQKISIARALLKNPPILIMDEPSNNLDEKTITWLKEFIRESEKTIIFVSHDEGLADLADWKLEL